MVLGCNKYTIMDCLTFDSKYRFWTFERCEFIFVYDFGKKTQDVGHYFFDLNLN